MRPIGEQRQRRPRFSSARLTFDPAQADEGVYFVATAGGETKVVTVQKNKAPQLAFLVPNLADASYHLEVPARMGTGMSARELRIGRLDSTLTGLPTHGLVAQASCL